MMAANKTNIYILRLTNGCYYVGKSDDPMRRYAEHVEGRGSAWTQRFHPVAVEKIVESASPFDEDKITKEYMARYGIDKVRGGSYVSIRLDDEQREHLQRELWAATDCCTICGRKGHFAAACFASTDIHGNELVDISDSESESDSDTCHRCGREGHYASECYARKNVHGRYI